MSTIWQKSLKVMGWAVRSTEPPGVWGMGPRAAGSTPDTQGAHRQQTAHTHQASKGCADIPLGVQRSRRAVWLGSLRQAVAQPAVESGGGLLAQTMQLRLRAPGVTRKRLQAVSDSDLKGYC